MDRLLQRIGILIAVLACASATGFGQIYVDASATGANNGSSWEDAYQDLQDALGVALDGDEIWVAAGTYSPGADTLSTFQLVEGVQVYGGFDGTEGAVEERDPAANQTILSGDANDNDLSGDFDANRDDNNFHVVYADTTITNATVIDGFTISGGNARRINTIANPMRSGGGGILSAGSPVIANCIITDNAAGVGGGLYPWDAGASRIKVLDCEITRNYALSGGGVFSDFAPGGLYSNSRISENTSQFQGAGQYKFASRDTFINCEINENQVIDTSGASGGGVHSIASQSIYVNCEFVGNVSTAAGGAFNCGDTLNQSFIFANCEFSENSAPSFGGALTLRQGSHAILNCDFNNNLTPFGGALISVNSSTLVIDSTIFEDNEALTSGGALYTLGGTTNITNCEFNENIGSFGGVHYNDGSVVNVMNSIYDSNTGNSQSGTIYNNSNGGTINAVSCTFEQNSAPWGGAVGDGGSISNYTDCLFEGNQADNGGGSGLVAFDGQMHLSGCVVMQNEAGFSGGGWYIQELTDFTSTIVSFENTRFTLNSNRDAGPNGMGFLVNGRADVTVDSCVFESNSASDTQDENAGGGAISVFGDSLSQGSLEITKSTFVGNIARLQGGAIELSNVNTQITNSIFFSNISTLGGAIINNGSFAAGSSMELVNNTFVLNMADSATDIAQWENPDNPNALASATLQNNIFVQGQGDGQVIQAEDGTPEVISNGGNLIRDMSLGSAAQPSDVQNENDAGFIDVGILDLRLDTASNAKDIGVNTGAPTDDITGSVRLMGSNTIVDAGAYERNVVATETYVADFAIDMTPTLTNDNVTITFDSKEMGDIQVLMFDYNGKVVYRSEDEKRAPTYRRTYNVGHLPSGTYFVRVMTAERIGGGKFVVAQ